MEELKALEKRISQPDTPTLPPDQIPFAAYLTARAVDGRRVEGEMLALLKKGNDAVLETRQWLHGGRGNVFSDLERTEGKSWLRTKAARSFATNLGGSDSAHAAGAIFTGSGNCGDFQGVAAYVLGDKLESQEVAHLVDARGIDHAFVELRNAAQARSSKTHQGDVVVDAWGMGPAVMAPDSEFSQGRRLPPSVATLDASSGPAFSAEVRENLDTLRQVPDEPQRRYDMLDTINQPLLSKAVFADTPVISKKFANRVAKKMAKEVKPGSKHQNPGLIERLRQIRAPETYPPDRLLPVRHEIRAAGVLRDLGHGIRTATTKENTKPITTQARALRSPPTL